MLQTNFGASGFRLLGTCSLMSSLFSGHQTLPGASLSHKESVFLKLNKRINALELNMSLSSEYLSELSRRYVEQTNDSRRHAEKVVKLAEEAAQNAARATQQKLAKQVFDLQYLRIAFCWHLVMTIADMFSSLLLYDTF